MKSCVSCGKQIPDEAGFCPYCGNGQERGFFCPNCGIAIKRARNYCPACGQELKAPGRMSGEAQPAAKRMPYASFNRMEGTGEADGGAVGRGGAGSRWSGGFAAGSGRSQNTDAGSGRSGSSAGNSGAGRFRTGGSGYRAYAGSPMAGGNLTQSGILAICQNVWMLVFCIVFTANLLIQMITMFSWFSILFYIVSIVLCCGLWLIYAGGRKNTLDVTGFTIVSVIQTIYFVLWCILGVVMVILAFLCFTEGDSAAAGILVLIMAFLMVYYQFVLRKTAHKAVCAVKGESDSVPVSMYSVVILCIGIVGRVILFFALLSLQSMLNSAASGIGLYGDGLSSLLGELMGASGDLSSIYGYSYGYDYAYTAGTELLATLTQSAVNLFKSLFGIQENILPTLLAIAASVCVVVLLMKLKACADKKR